MNAPFHPQTLHVREADLHDPEEGARLERFVAHHREGTPFHRPAWLQAAARGTRNRARILVAENDDAVCGILPLLDIHSALFGRVMVASGFGVDGGLLADAATAVPLIAAAEELAIRESCPGIELRGGPLPAGRAGWQARCNSHCGFVRDLAPDDESQLAGIPRKQRAEVRKSLSEDLTVGVGSGPADRAAHYRIYAESVRNLGTPVFPRQLFAEVLDAFGDAADILTVCHQGKPVASVLSLYHRGTVMPYWGGGSHDARRLRANDRMYFELMLHARRRGFTKFDFGRSKTDSGAFAFKKNWGFEPRPLGYATWTAPGAEPRDADPTSSKHARRIALWKRLPLGIANLLGPCIARGLG